MSKPSDVMLVGGGIIGLTTAYLLSQSGITCTVVDQGPMGREASWAGAGILPPGNPEMTCSPFDYLRARTVNQFPHLSQQLRDFTGIDNGYRRCGGIHLLPIEDQETPRLWKQEQIAFRPLTKSSLRSIHLPDSMVGYEFPDYAQVRNPWHLQALIQACRDRGVNLLNNRAIKRWHCHGTRIKSAELENADQIHAEQFVITAGAWSKDIVENLSGMVRLQLFPVRGQIVLMRSCSSELNSIIVAGKSYLVPRSDGRILVGSSEEPQAGFDKSTSRHVIQSLIQFASDLMPSLRTAQIEQCWAGLRPGTADGYPYLGPIPDYDNLYVATGHFRSGIQTSIATAEVLRDLLRGKVPAIPLDDFRLGRAPNAQASLAFHS